MFVCTFAYNVFGVGDTPIKAFHNMLEKAGDCHGSDGITPWDCHFFQERLVSIEEKTTWTIEPYGK